MASVPTAGEVDRAQWRYYRLLVDNDKEDVFLMQTIYTGSFATYIRAGALPTSSNYSLCASPRSNETVSLTAAARRSLGAPTGWYFIAVHGVSPASYLLTASINRNSFLPLYQGMSHTGEVDNGEAFYFYMEMPVGVDLNVTVSVHPTRGNPDVYMKLCTSAFDSTECQFSPTELQHPEAFPALKYSASQHGNEQISFPHAQALCLNSLCRYVICVTGKEDTAEFVILGTYEDRAEHFLRDGVPIGLSVHADSETFFKFQVYDPTVIRVSFQLTNIAGKSTFCFSTHTERPALSECSRSTNRNTLGDQRIDFVKSVDADALNLTYFVTVHAIAPTTFSILAQQQTPDANTTVTLFPGVSQRDTLFNSPASSYRFYTFQVHYTPSTAQPIVLSLTPFSGRFHMYVSNTLRSYDRETHFFSFNWSTEADPGRIDRENTLRIDTTDPAYLLDSIYEVLVMAMTYSDDSAMYAIVFTSGEGLLTLTEGVAFHDTVERGQYRYYQFPVPNLNETVTVTVAEAAGDPDLYLSTDPRNPKPTADDCDYRGERHGGEAVTVEWTERERARCRLSVHVCSVYISVYGYSQTVYSILAKAHPDVRTFVEHGKTARGELTDSQYSFYYSPIDSQKPVKVTLESVLGSCHLYAAVSSDPESLTVKSETSAYSAEASTYPGMIYLTSRSYPDTCATASCFLDFSVQCDSPKCRFSLVVVQDEDIQLTEGRPMLEHCAADQMTYFRFFNPYASSNLVLTLTHMSGGDPDLYVSKNERPSIGDSQWVSDDFLSDVLEISPREGETMQGEFYVGVYCDQPGAFSLSVSTNQTELVKLSAGRPQYGSLPFRSSRFYYYNSEYRANITITLTPKSGSAALFATSQRLENADIFDSLPSPLNHTWSSALTNEIGHITIGEKDAQFCTECNVVIAVVTEAEPCEYTVLVRTDDLVTMLQNGVPVRVRLSAHSKRLFAFELLIHSDLDIAMSTFSGRPEMFVSETPGDNYQWRTKAEKGVSHVNIRRGSKGYHAGWYYLRVEAGSQDCAISLTAHSRDSYVTLIDGWPQTYSISFDATDRLLFHYFPRNESATCRLSTWLRGFEPAVYLSYTPEGEFAEADPGPGTALQHFDKYDVFGVLSFVLPRLGLGSFQMAVYGKPTDGFLPMDVGDFQLYCVSTRGTTLVSLNDVEYGVLDPQVQHRQYELNVPEYGELLVSISPCSGSVQLSVTQNSTDSHDVVETHQKRVEDGQITATLAATPGAYYIVVEALGTQNETSYQLRTELLVGGSRNNSRLFPGSDGVIQWDEITEKIVRLTWAPPVYESGDSPRDLSSIRYRVYATLNSSALMTTSCGMDLAESREVAWLALSQGEEYGLTSVQVELPSFTSVTVNIMAITGREDDPDLENVPYRPVEVVLLRQTYEKYLYKTLFAAAGLIVALIGGAVYLKCKSRNIERTTMQLTEMVGLETVKQTLESPRTQRMSTDMMSPRDTMGLMLGMPNSTEGS